MADKKKDDAVRKVIKKRGLIQCLSTLLTNIHLPNFPAGSIYTGKGKAVCVPGLNCYSCPGAAGACPIGSFQAVAGSSKFSFSYYIFGILIFIGVFLGRVVCGFLCPFGWFQDLLHKIPFKKFSTKKVKYLTFVKYFILALFVIILPAAIVSGTGMGTPYFCKYICPQGILEGGIFLSLANKSIAAAIGILFKWKFVILIVFVVLSLMIYRPFCKWICPLGALYSLFNKISFVQYNVDTDKCVSCGKCASVCKMDVDVTKNANALECIRCGACIKNCPTEAINVKWGRKTIGKKERKQNEG